MKRLLFFFFIVFASCGDDSEPLTSGEKNAQMLQKVVSDSNLSTATVYQSSIKLYGSESFSIESSFIVVGTTYFNLDKLLGFEVYVNASQRTLILYFE